MHYERPDIANDCKYSDSDEAQTLMTIMPQSAAHVMVYGSRKD